MHSFVDNVSKAFDSISCGPHLKTIMIKKINLTEHQKAFHEQSTETILNRLRQVAACELKIIRRVTGNYILLYRVVGFVQVANSRPAFVDEKIDQINFLNHFAKKINGRLNQIF